MSPLYRGSGELIDDQTVKLDKALPTAAGRVRVTLEFESSEAPPDLLQFMERMWEEQHRRGHVPPTKEEVDGYLNAERDSWGF
jgi:hypothetical protein